ncbi:hypothetical protein HELRODRAFT_165247 [Helobdella robusta]|uniref:Uncharacterized protein n=1 Tax=Helobdella robusta TaxID=6412 RepID=T1EWH7_HELRO|nr:hypothetical protein HELRODRAFT_165247 [Helobdella robusta]ESN93087.1 hypothetical protein HELRODRAFT_165247 [Helobdella robusta]
MRSDLTLCPALSIIASALCSLFIYHLQAKEFLSENVFNSSLTKLIIVRILAKREFYVHIITMRGKANDCSMSMAQNRCKKHWKDVKAGQSYANFLKYPSLESFEAICK